MRPENEADIQNALLPLVTKYHSQDEKRWYESALKEVLFRELLPFCFV